MSRVIVQAVNMLNQGIDGKNVVEYLRTHYNTTCSLKTQVSMVKRLYILQKENNKHPLHESTLKRFEKYYKSVRPTLEDQCVQRSEEFLNASFFLKYKAHNRHRKKLFCIGHEGLDKRFKAIKFLPNHTKSLKITSNESISCRNREREARVEKNQSVIDIENSNALLRDAIQTLETATTATSYPKLCCALLLVTGRRMTEIMNGKSSFDASKDSEYACIFTGQLKKQSAAKPYKIPLLCKYATLKHGIGTLRKKQGDSVKDLNNDEVSKKYNKNVRRSLKAIFPTVKTPHDIRGVYARMVFEAFTFDKLTFARVAMLSLGHASLTESLSYNHIHIHNFNIKLGHFTFA